MTSQDPPTVLAAGKFVRLVKRGRWEWAERTHPAPAAILVALTANHELVLVEQFRIPLDRRVVELPAGLVGDLPGSENEALQDAARRELLEETGFAAEHLEYLLEGPSSAGMTSETYAMLLATGLKRVGPGGGEESEDIDVHVIPLAEVEDWLTARRIVGVAVDPRVYLGIYFSEKHLAKSSS